VDNKGNVIWLCYEHIDPNNWDFLIRYGKNANSLAYNFNKSITSYRTNGKFTDENNFFDIKKQNIEHFSEKI
jgi:hypothetical protein